MNDTNEMTRMNDTNSRGGRARSVVLADSAHGANVNSNGNLNQIKNKLKIRLKKCIKRQHVFDFDTPKLKQASQNALWAAS